MKKPSIENQNGVHDKISLHASLKRQKNRKNLLQTCNEVLRNFPLIINSNVYEDENWFSVEALAQIVFYGFIQ